MFGASRLSVDKTRWEGVPRRVLPSKAHNVNALRYLVEVTEARSFAEAARRLGINPTTLSRNISTIEDQLGLTLFERSRSGVRLTTAGRPVVKQIRRVLSELAAVLDAARANGTGIDGEVRLWNSVAANCRSLFLKSSE